MKMRCNHLLHLPQRARGVAPVAYLRLSFDIIVGYVHPAGISHESVYDNNLAVIAMKDVVDVRKAEGIKFINLNALGAQGFLSVYGAKGDCGGISKPSNNARIFTP